MESASKLVCALLLRDRKGDDNKRRVLVSGSLGMLGGVETHVYNLCRLLVERGAEVTFVARSAKPDLPLIAQRRQIPVRVLLTPFSHRVRWSRASIAWAMLTWPALLRREFDVLYTFDIDWFATFLARFVKPGGYVLGTSVGEIPPNGKVHPRTRALLNGFIAETEIQGEAARRFNDLLAPVAAIPTLGNVSAAQRRTARKVERLRVVFLGRYEAIKGAMRLIALWSELDIQPARLDFYGHGPQRPQMEREIVRRGLGSEVAVHGGWSGAAELADILEGSDMVVLPSSTEGLPLVLLEAMAHGVPFVATDVGAVRTLAEDNPDARVVSLDDDALKQAIEEVASGLRRGTISGERLQRYHESRYSHERIARRWVEALLEPEQFWGRLATEGAAREEAVAPATAGVPG